MSEPPSDALALLEADPPVRVIGGEASLPAAGSGEVRARIAGAEITGEKDLFAAIARALSFPSWFGENWDALLDCLRDVGADGEAPAAVTLIVEDADALFSRTPRAAPLLVETWLSAALWWARRGVPFRLCLLVGR